MIKVNFRIVGMYLGDNDDEADDAVVVTVKDNPTLLDIMTEVSKMAANGQLTKIDLFSFSPANPTPNEDLTSIFVNYTQPPRDNRDYPAGLYVLADDNLSNPITTFQYYIYNKGFVQLNRNNTTAPFAGPPDREIKDGYNVIIRQVAILVGPNRAKLIERRAKLNADFINGTSAPVI